MKKRDPGFVTLLLAVLVLPLVPACTTVPDPEAHRFEDPYPYYLYLPQSDDPETARPLFIGVHGSATEGQSCWQTWQPHADEKGYALLCPLLADPDGRLHQLHGNQRLNDIVYRLYLEHALEPVIFLAGFSGGAKFVEGYAFMNPAYISAVSLIAGANYYPPPQATGRVPFAVIVGDRDDPLTAQDAWDLTALLKEGGHEVELHVLSGAGHEISPESVAITLALYERVAGAR